MGYRTEKYPDSFVSMVANHKAGSQVSFGELLFNLHTAYYPTKTFRKVNVPYEFENAPERIPIEPLSQEGYDIKRISGDDFEIIDKQDKDKTPIKVSRHDSFEFFYAKTVKNFFDALLDKTPDFTSKYSLGGEVDKTVSTFIAWYLIHQDKINTPADIREAANQAGVLAPNHDIINGFLNLVSSESVQALKQQGIQGEQLDLVFSGTADWLQNLSKDALENKKQQASMYFFPYPAETLDKTLPAVEFLPYLYNLYANYIAELPGLIKPRENFDISMLFKHVNRIVDVAASAIKHDIGEKVEDPDMPLSDAMKVLEEQDPSYSTRMKGIVAGLQQQAKGIANQVRFLKNHPFLLNRKGVSSPTEGSIKSLNTMRDEILQSGGDASKNMLSFRLRNFNSRNM